MADRVLPFGAPVRHGAAALKERRSDACTVWVKVPATGALAVALLDPEPFVYEGHYINGRMRPCPGRDSCVQCGMRMRQMVRAVFAVYEIAAKRAGLLEVNDRTGLEVIGNVETTGIGRGLVIHFRKEDRRVNGAIRCVCQNQIWRESELPDTPDVEYILKTQWAMEQSELRPIVGTRSY